MNQDRLIQWGAAAIVVVLMVIGFAALIRQSEKQPTPAPTVAPLTIVSRVGDHTITRSRDRAGLWTAVVRHDDGRVEYCTVDDNGGLNC